VDHRGLLLHHTHERHHQGYTDSSETSDVEVKLRKFCKMFWAMLILFTFR